MTTRYIARRLPRQTGQAGWNAILPPRQAFAALDDDLTVDVTIIGGGFAGLSAARRLHQLDPALRVAVVEAGQFGESSAGRNSGFMIDLPHDLSSENYAGDAVEGDRAVIARNRRAIAFAKDVAAECDLSTEILDPCGKLNAAATPAGDQHNRDYGAHLRRLGEVSEFFDDRQMQALTGSSHYTSGLFTPGTVMLQPAAYIRALAAHLTPQMQVFENTAATGFEQQGGHWRVNTPKGGITTGRVILANNGHLGSFGFYPRQLMPICLYASMSADLSDRQIKTLGGQPRWGVTPSDPMGTSVRRISGSYGNRILIRTCATYTASLQASARQVQRAGRIHDRKFRERFPHLPDVQMEHRWAGMLCLSRNGSAAFGELAPNVFSACCQNGLGTARGTLQGMGIAEMMMKGRSAIADHFLAEPELPRLPPGPVAGLGANAYLRWKEWRSGRE